MQRLEKEIDLFTAITTLIKASDISQETDLLHITPGSIHIKNIPDDIEKKLKLRSDEFEQRIIQKLYTKSTVIKRCMDLYSSYLGSWDLVHLAAGKRDFDIPATMQIFASRKCNEAREEKERQVQKSRPYKTLLYDDDWCP